MTTRVTAHRDFTIASVDPRIYSAFLEHLGRAVYTGIHEPGHPTADAEGMRGDVADLVRGLNPPFVRYPGGNFVSAYNWEDGIGPKDQRPVRLDLAWHTSESNQVGLHEFAAWCDKVGTQMMLAINLGSRGLDEARNLVEYANGPTGSHWGDLRAKNGHPAPFDCRIWCLGNEMDGPWQVGHKTADEYGRLAMETAKTLRAFDKTLELVVCGSSNADMKTYPEWERIVLDHCYEAVDYISLHMYFQNKAKDTGAYLALNRKLEDYIDTVAATIRQVKANKRSNRDVFISFDEWNVWYHSHAQDRAILDGAEGWPHAPRLLEDVYNFEDVLQVALILNSFIRKADVVKIACIAQLVNVIAPIMTEPGGAAWRQTIYYPYQLASQHGRGTALQLAQSGPVSAAGLPHVDIASVLDEADGVLTCFVVNRHNSESQRLDLSLEGFGAQGRLIDHQVMVHADLSAVNSAENPFAVAPCPGSGARMDGARLTADLPPLSYQMLRVRLA